MQMDTTIPYRPSKASILLNRPLLAIQPKALDTVRGADPSQTAIHLSSQLVRQMARGCSGITPHLTTATSIFGILPTMTAIQWHWYDTRVDAQTKQRRNGFG